MVFAGESLTTIGRHGVGGDLLFVTAGFSGRCSARCCATGAYRGTRAIAVVGVLSLAIYAPIYGCSWASAPWSRLGLAENLFQVLVQGLLAGALPIYLFARAVILIGAGRTAVFPALVPGFGVIIGYLALGVVPSVPQLVGLVIVVVGFRFVVK